MSRRKVAEYFRTSVIGDSGVGKTSILKRMEKGEFDEKHVPTVGVDFIVQHYTDKRTGLEYKLQLWDSAGQEVFRSIAQNFYRSADAVIIVFDLLDIKSINDIAVKWLSDVDKLSPEHSIKILVGNKSDGYDARTDWGNTKGVAQKICQEYGYEYMEVSAKDGTNVRELLEKMAISLIDIRNEQKKYQNNQTASFSLHVKNPEETTEKPSTSRCPKCSIT